MYTLNPARGKPNPSKFYNETCHLLTILSCKLKNIPTISPLLQIFYCIFGVD